jgi:hypothetical protein
VDTERVAGLTDWLGGPLAGGVLTPDGAPPIPIVPDDPEPTGKRSSGAWEQTNRPDFQRAPGTASCSAQAGSTP